jgi:uncharacterized membrane protein YiaA
MTSIIIRWTSVVVMLLGVISLTLYNVGLCVESIRGQEDFIVPIAYFTILAGAVGLSWGWFLKQRER